MRATLTKTCLLCGKQFTIPQCRDWRENCCSSACKKAYRSQKSDELKQLRTRQCQVCGKAFVVKKSQLDVGGGRYCSRKCYGLTRAGAPLSPETRKKISEGQYRAMAAGKLIHRTGQDHPHWTGGRQAYLQRRAESRYDYHHTKNYRAKYPEKVREWSSTRRARKTGRLPRGTIARLYKLQRGRCAICAVELNGKYHADHIVALAKGGKHEPQNIQLLCGPCNVHKAAKDPIAYMQELGRLI